MGSDVLIRIRKCVVICTRMCCRSVRGHPFLFGFLFLLYCFHRSCPVLFSLIVSASPVLVTTALLLGTLLSYGESNVPEFEEEEVSEQRSASEGVVVERDAGFDVGKVKKGRDLENEDSDDEKESELERGDVKEYDSEEEFGDDEDDYNKPLIKGASRKGVLEKWKGEDVGRESARSFEVDDEKNVSRTLEEGSGSGHAGEGEGEGTLHGVLENVEYERLETEDNHSVGGSADDPYALDTVYSSFRLSPKREEANDHPGSGNGSGSGSGSGSESDSQKENDRVSETGSDEDEDENSSESESDADESSSPDASMTDITPLLDELHPLLDEDVPQQAQGGVNSTARRSVDASSIDSGEDTDHHEDEDGEDDNEEDAQSNKGEGDKPEITWTEDDQKNLMDMGTSELERNQRLENLIARRRARKMTRLADEKNLIDLESNDLPFNVPHISTLRRNPFDSPIDSYDAMGLPPIPGSAPSIMQPRRNPFDLPYDQNEEKPILTGDNFAQEIIPPQRDSVFRRYESFSVGPMNGGSSRQDMRRRPYFAPERTAAEEAYALFQRQLSEVSESKASSVPETEWVSSASEDEHQKITEPELTETNMISKDEHDSDQSEYESQSSEDAESVDVQQTSMDVNQNEFEIQLGGHGSLQETETHMVSIDESSSHFESVHSVINMRVHAVDDESSEGSSHSSPTVEMHAEHDEISVEMAYVPEGFPQVETVRSEMRLPTEQVGDESDSSSVTSLSDTNEEVSDTVGRNESIDETGDIINNDSHSPVHSPVGESSANLKVEIPDDHHFKEPVYDSSPTVGDRGLLFSSSSTDHQLESSELGDSTHLPVGNENEEDRDGNTPHEHVQLRDVEILTDVGQSSISEAANEDHPNLKAEQASHINDGSSSSDTDSSEENTVGNSDEKDVIQVEHDEVQSSTQDHNESMVVVEDSNVGPNASSDSDSDFNSNSVDDHMNSGIIQVDRDELPTPSSDDEDNINQKRVSEETSNPLAAEPEIKSPIVETPAASSLDHNMDSSSTVEAELIKTSSVDTAPRIIPEVSVAIPRKNRLIESIKEMRAGGVSSDKLDEFQTPVSARYFDFTSEEFQPNATDIDEVEDETDDFKELDEAMLAELDTVGDFSVPNAESSVVNETGMAFHHIDDEVPVEEVILPSLLFGGRAVVSTENEESKDFPMSETDSPFSVKEVSSDIEELVPSYTDALEKTEREPASSSSSPNAESLAEGFHAQEHAHVESLKQSLEETPEKSPIKDEKTELEPTSTVSAPNSEVPKEESHALEHDHTESPKHSPEETPVKSPSKKEKSHDSSSSSSSSDSD